MFRPQDRFPGIGADESSIVNNGLTSAKPLVKEAVSARKKAPAKTGLNPPASFSLRMSSQTNYKEFCYEFHCQILCSPLSAGFSCVCELPARRERCARRDRARRRLEGREHLRRLDRWPIHWLPGRA